MNELPIVVTCTDRKTSPPEATLQARALPKTGLAERAAEWARRLHAVPGPRIALEDLYQGDQWRRAQALTKAASQAGFVPRLYVASAGLGLRPVSSLAPSYAATFLPRHADSVASSSAQATDWWDHLQRMDGSCQLPQIAAAAGRALVVLSETYAAAMHRDLAGLAATGTETVLIGGACELDGIVRVPANAALRHALGGTRTSLNVRMAASWLEHCTPGHLITPSARKRWSDWVEQVARPERYERRPMTDEAVIDFIEQSKDSHPGSSRTRLLRLLRDQGMACEQKRFANLYTATIGPR
ncbi:hypothetical protein BIU87_18925 [Streptomyces sp. ZS0098]|uniref:hypothetical protein n=1 Tax=Streptomyces sp. ZS0098 TaxID=1904044 RepID=UPI000EFBCEDB|nr:hypothetical protein [Streptomyces sp. ZS0098]RMI92264.1 hypothetical protein BIU87_18925 [Streptomyces sp. ZS0098]